MEQGAAGARSVGTGGSRVLKTVLGKPCQGGNINHLRIFVAETKDLREKICAQMCPSRVPAAVLCPECAPMTVHASIAPLCPIYRPRLARAQGAQPPSFFHFII